jgi:hypothetical protein
MSTFHRLRQQLTLVAADIPTLLRYTFADGKGFPPSYIDFAMELGWGRLCRLFLVYIPLAQLLAKTKPSYSAIHKRILRRNRARPLLR